MDVDAIRLTEEKEKPAGCRFFRCQFWNPFVDRTQLSHGRAMQAFFQAEFYNTLMSTRGWSFRPKRLNGVLHEPDLAGIVPPIASDEGEYILICDMHFHRIPPTF